MLTVGLIGRAGAAVLEKRPQLLLDCRKRVFLLEFVMHISMSPSVSSRSCIARLPWTFWQLPVVLDFSSLVRNRINNFAPNKF